MSSGRSGATTLLVLSLLVIKLGPGAVQVVEHHALTALGVVAGLATLQLAPTMTPAVGTGIVVAVVSAVLFEVYARRDSARYIDRMIRFRGDPNAEARSAEAGSADLAGPTR